MWRSHSNEGEVVEYGDMDIDQGFIRLDEPFRGRRTRL
jgi:hypothetical protein